MAFLRIASARESSSVATDPSAATAWRLLRRNTAAAGGCTFAGLTMQGGSVAVATPNMAGSTAPGIAAPPPLETGEDGVGGGIGDAVDPSVGAVSRKPPPPGAEEGGVGVGKTRGTPPTITESRRPSAGRTPPPPEVVEADWEPGDAGSTLRVPPPKLGEEGEAGETTLAGGNEHLPPPRLGEEGKAGATGAPVVDEAEPPPDAGVDGEGERRGLGLIGVTALPIRSDCTSAAKLLPPTTPEPGAMAISISPSPSRVGRVLPGS